MEKRRAGLDVGMRLWIILDEYNQDSINRSFYLEAEAPLGRFSKAFFLPLMREFIARRARTRESIAGAKRPRSGALVATFTSSPESLESRHHRPLYLGALFSTNAFNPS
jgi:hypothetical protein